MDSGAVSLGGLDSARARLEPEVGRHPPSVRGEPSISALRLARLLGNTALEARARAVLDDKLTRLAEELSVVLDPGDEIAKADLAYLDAR